ncbi:hypothetical protein EYF80_066785 [Liparis tanakae]|uniref:Uncharacterized protein n=1 Tax=Liparis tanakae TaxID=230148 RepID=A0A4Z2E2W3_9TELE|nr:hypothetical protein EYF80_066785 [Liparis tanakae]
MLFLKNPRRHEEVAYRASGPRRRRGVKCDSLANSGSGCRSRGRREGALQRGVTARANTTPAETMDSKQSQVGCSLSFLYLCCLFSCFNLF